MDSPPQSPNHVFNFPENEEEFEEDPQEDPEEEVEEWDDMDIIEEEEEDPEEDPEEWDDVDAAEQVDEIPHPVTPPRNPTAVPHSSPGQSSESEDNDLAISDEAQDASPPKSTYEIGSTSNAHATVSAPMIITSVDEPVSQVEELSRNVHYLLRESGIKGKEAKVLKTEMKKLAKRMDSCCCGLSVGEKGRGAWYAGEHLLLRAWGKLTIDVCLSIQRILSHAIRPKPNGFPLGTLSIAGQAFIGSMGLLSLPGPRIILPCLALELAWLLVR
ncbi:hypothetical protein Tco_1165173, partial [Tanacetum coccineum]